jgi:aspartokinase
MGAEENNLVVQKYGGASLATPERIQAIAQKIKERWQRGEKLVVVVSAMGQATDQLVKQAYQISSQPNLRELDILVSSGERVAMALLSMALNEAGVRAASFTGSQAGILTTEEHFQAKIVGLRPERLKSALAEFDVIVVAGFQGVSEIKKEITTLGRGGSDTTAVALAIELGASRCEILKEVKGVLTADPKKEVPAVTISEMSLEFLAKLSFWGAKVVQFRAARLALKYQLPIEVGTALDQKIYSRATSKLSSPLVATSELPTVLCLIWPTAKISELLFAIENQQILTELIWLGLSSELSEANSERKLEASEPANWLQDLPPLPVEHLQVFFKTSQSELKLTRTWLEQKFQELACSETTSQATPLYWGSTHTWVWERPLTDQQDGSCSLDLKIYGELFSELHGEAHRKLQSQQDSYTSGFVVFGSLEAGELHRFTPSGLGFKSVGCID